MSPAPGSMASGEIEKINTILQWGGCKVQIGNIRS